MNLKRLRGIATVAFTTIAAALLAGCMNQMAGSVDGSSQKAVLSLSATGIPEEYAKEFAAYCEKQNASSRTILPDDPYDIGGIGSGSGQSTGLVLYLTGKSETGMTYGPEEVTLNSGTTVDGKTVYNFNEKIAMDSMSWNLVLTAYTDATRAKAVLVGYCSVDLRNGSGTATFVMGIAGLTTPGSVELSGTIVDKDGLAKSYTMGIYRKDNGKDVGTTEQTVASFDVSDDNTFIFNANNKEVPPGTYLYTMIFYGADKGVVGSFTDTIVINPGNALKDDTLVIDVIGRKPTEPEDLKAYLVDGSESSDGRTYNVKVTWTQASYATNYELNVVESAGDGTDIPLPVANTPALITGGTIYGMASMDKTTPTKIVNDFPGSVVFGTGSSYMMYGDESCVLKLETGKVYEIQLRARNYLGTSDWIAREAGGTETDCTAYDEPSKQRINRMLITYNLNGGTLKTGSNSKSYTNKYAEYKSWTVDDDLLKIVEIAGDPTGDQNTLKKGTTAFAGWLLEDGTAVKSDGIVTTTREDAVEKYMYKNVTVVASFGNEVSANVSQEDRQKDIDLNHITVEYGSDTASTELTKTGNLYILSKMDNGVPNKIQVTLNNVGTSFATTGTEYTNVKFEVWGQSETMHTSVTQTSPGVCLVNTAKYTEGKMYIMVIADTKTVVSASRTLVFELTK